MSFPDLRSFLDRLRAEGQLAVVEVPVDAAQEAAEIHRRVVAAGGPALLFESVPPARFPLVTNLFGTPGRARLAFGEKPFEWIARVAAAPRELVPPTPRKLWAARRLALDALRVGFRRRRSGPVTEVVTAAPDLGALPALTTWPRDGGPFLTLPTVYTEHPDGLGHNLGVYRLQVHGPAETGMHWQIGKGGGFHYQVAEARGEALPVTVFLGGPPALVLAAIAPLPENVPELLLASLVAGRRLALCDGPGAHPLIADAEFALCGRVEPRERRPEGPFGDHYGYYSLAHDYPVLRIDHLCHRRDAIYPATVVGKPRQEDFYIGDLLQELLAPLFPLVMPGVEDLWSYGETGYHSLAAAVVKERYKREAMASAFRILGEGQLSLTKFLLVVDRPLDLRDFRSTLVHLLARTRPETDLFVLSNLSMDTLDYAGPAVNEGSKGVWLGLGEPVRDLPGEFSAAELPRGVESVAVYCPGCLVVGGPSQRDEPDFGARIAAHPAFAGWMLIVASDEPRRAAASDVNFLWTTFTRFDPASDLYAADVKTVRNHLAYAPPIVLDARLRPGFPEELSCDEEVAAKVSRRWKEYFPEGKVEMGDSERGHLS
ncbi:MAG: UbiD family decarboxylase [Acidobacteriota bacterium]|nr:UbiD family decarboxylase [Acidobacteriota bacterium]